VFNALGSVPHGLTGDEAQDGFNARQGHRGEAARFLPENNGREGLNLSARGDVGVLTVWATYLLHAEFFHQRTGLWAARSEAASTFHSQNSRWTRRATAAPFFLALALY
jgi:hypothetical protein